MQVPWKRCRQSGSGKERYQDALSEGVFRMQQLVDKVACNKDTVVFKVIACGVSLSSSLADA